MSKKSLYFADISNNNSEFHPKIYRRAGHVIVAIKASEGTSFADPRSRGWCLAAGANHIQVVHYHFGRPDKNPSEAGGIKEAEFFLHCVNGLLGPHDYVVYDGERARNGAFGLDPAHCAGFDAHIREHTRFATILYGSASVLATPSTADALGGDNKRDWCADYSNDPDTHANGHTTVMRQLSDGAVGPLPHTLPGVGRCDVNVLRGEFARQVFANAG